VTGVNLNEALVDESRRWLFVREVGGANRGPAVDRFCLALNDTIAHAWCAAFVAFCVKEIEEKFGVKSQLSLSEHVLTMWKQSEKYQSKFPQPGSIAIWKMAGTSSGHCGIVVEVDPKGETFKTIEGNTSDGTGLEREGDGVFLKTRRLNTVGNFKLMGFLKPF
jgi:hypothetical protein